MSSLPQKRLRVAVQRSLMFVRSRVVRALQTAWSRDMWQAPKPACARERMATKDGSRSDSAREPQRRHHTGNRCREQIRRQQGQMVVNLPDRDAAGTPCRAKRPPAGPGGESTRWQLLPAAQQAGKVAGGRRGVSSQPARQKTETFRYKSETAKEQPVLEIA